MPQTMNVAGELNIKINGTSALLLTSSGVTAGAAYTAPVITASTEFRGTILTSNSTSAVAIKTSGGTQFNVSHTASAVNFWQVSGAPTGGQCSMLSTGSDTNVTALYSTKGAGIHTFYSDNFGATQFQVARTASSVDYLQVSGGATGSPGVVTMSAVGSDSNIDAAIQGKGTGVIRLASHQARYLTVTGSPGSTVTLSASDGDLVLTSGGGGARVTSPISISAHSATAIPAGGTAGAGLLVSSTSNFGIFFGSGLPSLAAAQGSLYLRSDGSSTSTRLYVNTDGSTSWANLTASA